jgi:CheY-like chemotaxis protein
MRESSRFAQTGKRTEGPKPRVLLVDDHRRVLDTVSAMLSDDFDVVGMATDGRQAIDTAHQVHPDVIVLDVEMPGIDGFETRRALEHGGLSTPVVFMSMHDGEDIIGEAFRCGGRGYVLKSRVVRDLPIALNQALLGRLFVPSLTSLFRVAGEGMHAMQLHRSMKSFLDGLAAFFDLALRRGDATSIIATNAIREGLTSRLRARGWDVGGSSGHERYLVADSGDAINRFMRNGLPDPDRIAEIVAEIDQYRRAVSEGETSRLVVCGDIATLLSAAGNTEAVIALERQWGALTRDLPIVTLCCYGTACFDDDAPDLWSDTCAQHVALSHASDV